MTTVEIPDWERTTGPEVERCRLAWMSARGRAAAYADALEKDREERDGLRAALSGALKALDHAEGLIEERDQRICDLAADLVELRAVHAQCKRGQEER